MLVAYRFASAIIMTFVCIGCAYKNEGAIDYRKAAPTSSTETSSNSNKNDYVFTKKFDTSPLQDNIIAQDDTISIFLNHACIASFHELPNITKFESKKTTRGEIAIVAKVTEMKTSSSMDFSSKASDSGRLVYYNDDVRRHQPLNLSFLPIYGPQKYNGNPLAIQLYILELDEADTEQFSGLLKTMASLGTAANPAAAPLLGVLEKLGTAFLQSNWNDVIFRYNFVLLPGAGNTGNIPYPVLEAGNYVLVRKDNRQSEPDWSHMTFDKGTGQVNCSTGQVLPADLNCAVPVRCDDTYLTLTILRNVAKNTNISEAAQTLSDFIKAEYGPSPVLKGVKDALESLEKLQKNNNHQGRLDLLNNQLIAIAHYQCPADVANCTPAWRNFVLSLGKEISATKAAVLANTTNESDVLKPDELKAIIEKAKQMQFINACLDYETYDSVTALKAVMSALAPAAKTP